jgi:hypothetical protein
MFDWQPMRQLWCHRVPRPATLPEVQRRRYVGTAAAEARNPRGVDDAGLLPGAPHKGPTGKAFVPFGVGLVELEDVIRVEGRLTETTRRNSSSVWTSS